MSDDRTERIITFVIMLLPCLLSVIKYASSDVNWPRVNLVTRFHVSRKVTMEKLFPMGWRSDFGFR